MKIAVEWFVTLGETDYELSLQVSYRAGSPEVRYLRNGDPGHPGDPAEIDIITMVSRPELPPGMEETVKDMLVEDDSLIETVGEIYAEKRERA